MEKEIYGIKGNRLVLSEPYQNDREYEYAVFNVSGQRVLNGKILGDQIRIGLPITGLYIIHVFDRLENTVQIEKMVYFK